MNIDWQTIAALACVTVAMLFLGHRVWRLVSGSGGGCGSCPANVAAGSDSLQPKPFVALDDLQSSSPSDERS